MKLRLSTQSMLNFEILQKTPVFGSLSQFGKNVRQNPGIFYWATRAKQEAEINATIGSAIGKESDLDTAFESKIVTYYLPEIREYISLPPSALVTYAPVNGINQMRDLWEKWIVFKGKKAIERNNRLNESELQKYITKPIICSGVTNGIQMVCKLFMDPRTHIISSNKRWENYDAIISGQGDCKILSFEFFKEGRFNYEALRKVMEEILTLQDKVVMILNFPNNPTGYSPTYDEIQNITQMLHSFCEEHQKPVVILCDDAYEGYVYESDRSNHSIFYDLLNLHPMIIPIKLDGASKEMLMYGARIAAITLGIHPNWISDAELPQFNKEWENKLEAMIRQTISNCNHLAQEIQVAILSKGFEKLIAERKNVVDILAERYRLSVECLKKIKNSNITMDPAGGGFFLFLNLKNISANDLANLLIKKYKVGVIPSVNLEENINGIRVAYCSVLKEQIEELFKRIDEACKELMKQ